MTKLILLFSIFFSLNSFAQTPSYETVLSFLNKVILVNPMQGNFELQKKPEGFFICTNQYEDGKARFVDCQKIWNAATNEFITPVYDNSERYSENENTDIKSRFSALWSQRHYVRPLIYYGYSDWIKDTKQLLENKSNLSSQELETLARTYFAEANEFIHPGQYGFMGREKATYEDAGFAKISEERVKGFKSAYDKGLETWELINEKVPSYSPNLITNLELKIGNEYMHGYFTFLCIQEPKLAEEYLKKTSYSESVINYAKRLLDGCEKDAILFTNGDSDTYPLWYAQDELGYRKDVIIINLSLAQTAWYLEYIQDKYQFKSSFEPAEIRANDTKYFLFRDSAPISFSKWRKSFQRTKKGASSNDENHIYVNGSWKIESGSSTYSIKDTKKYAAAYEVFIYDLLASNPAKRVYGTSNYSFINLGLEDYSLQYGSLTRLEPKAQITDFNEESKKQIIEEISTIPAGYYPGLGDWQSNQRINILSRLNLISSESAKQLVPIVEKNILSDLKLETCKPDLARSINYFFYQFDEQKQNTFKSTYDPFACQFVNNFEVDPATLFNELDLFYDLISIYSAYYNSDLYSDDELSWEGSEQLYAALIMKLEELNEFCITQNLTISAERVSDLSGILERIKRK